MARWTHKHWAPREACWPKILVWLVVRPTLKTAAALTSEEGGRDSVTWVLKSHKLMSAAVPAKQKFAPLIST